MIFKSSTYDFFSWIKFQICNLTCSWLTICNFRFEKLDLPGWKIVQCHRHSVEIFSFIAKTLKIQQNFPCSWNKIPNCIYSSSEFQSWSGQLWIDSSKCSSYTFSANWYWNEFTLTVNSIMADTLLQELLSISSTDWYWRKT